MFVLIAVLCQKRFYYWDKEIENNLKLIFQHTLHIPYHIILLNSNMNGCARQQTKTHHPGNDRIKNESIQKDHITKKLTKPPSDIQQST